jgi:DNA modification methylase
MLRKPSELGYDDDGFILPPIQYSRGEVQTDALAGALFPMQAQTLNERLQARRGSVQERTALCAEIVNGTPGQWLVWCNLNAESRAASGAIPDSMEVTGSDTREAKEEAILKFTSGQVRVLVSKPSIFGFGLNLQNCHQVAFLGLSDSYEQFYQAVRRSWRFGQSSPVQVHIITADTEGAVVENIKRKEAEASEMASGMVAHMQDITSAELHGAKRDTASYERDKATGKQWTLHLADCVELVSEVESDSIHYSIFSPPFASLYTYSNSERDMGNSRDHQQFAEHFAFVVSELYRMTMPGRLCSFHCMNLPTSKMRDGVIGLTDFRGDLIRLFEKAGWIYHSEVVIWKDPVTAMQRTKALGLLHKQLKKDSAMSRQGIPDYLVTMRKPGSNPEPVSHTNESFPVSLWQRYASPIWTDINAQDTLQYRAARTEQDERHICPLQLEVIRRALVIWTNPGDVVFSPFAGIGSEGYIAIEEGRRFLGVELKRSYWEQAIRNLRAAKPPRTLFDEDDLPAAAAVAERSPDAQT